MYTINAVSSVPSRPEKKMPVNFQSRVEFHESRPLLSSKKKTRTGSAYSVNDIEMNVTGISIL